MNYQERVTTRADVRALYGRVIANPAIARYRGYTETKSYGWDNIVGDYIKEEGEVWFDNPAYDPLFAVYDKDPKADDQESEIQDRLTAKHPHYNCQRGMLCPTCDKALWERVEIRGLFFKKKIVIKEQPNFCKYCGQKLKAAYSEV